MPGGAGAREGERPAGTARSKRVDVPRQRPTLRRPDGRSSPERRSQEGSPPEGRSRRPFQFLLIALVAGGLVTGVVLTRPAPPERISLTEAVAAVSSGQVAAATVDPGTVTLERVDGSTVRAAFPADYSDELTSRLLDSGVEVRSGGGRAATELALRILPVLLIAGILVWVVRRMNPHALGGKKRAPAAVPSVSFRDVAGVDEAVEQLRELVLFLREPERFHVVGAKRPRGALLVGPPGTGKTLLARAVAGEAGVPFFVMAGSDFMETFVGVGARRVRDLFAQARKAERAIVFIDEVDAVGRARGGVGSGGADGERENTLISLLNEMDGFAASNVVVLAATNRPDTLDPALTRPGRLDRQIHVPNPDRRGRTQILHVHAAGRPLVDDVDLVQVARQTPGMSGADLANVVNEACIEAARRRMTAVDAACFQAAVETVAMGRARTSALVTDADRRVTAWHEAGHTLAAALLDDADDPVSVTIVPRGPAGGATWMGGSDDVFLPRPKALAQLTVAMAGRAAEELLLAGEYTQGASGDLQSATRLATAMVTQYGMSDFGYAQLDAESMRIGGQVAARAHDAVDRLLRDAHQRAQHLLAENAARLEALATALAAEETLSGAQIRRILQGEAAEHVTAG